MHAGDLHAVLSNSDYVFVLAGATKDNQGFLGKPQFDVMRDNTAPVLPSRALIVNFPELLDVARTGQIRIATDVFRQSRSLWMILRETSKT